MYIGIICIYIYMYISICASNVYTSTTMIAYLRRRCLHLLIMVSWTYMSAASYPMDLLWCDCAPPTAAFLSVVSRKAKEFRCKLPVVSHLHQSCPKQWPGSLPAFVSCIPSRAIMPGAWPDPCGQTYQWPLDDCTNILPSLRADPAVWQHYQRDSQWCLLLDAWQWHAKHINGFIPVPLGWSTITPHTTFL